jgi:flagellar motility protein MotE (MotC chaperone)
MGKIVTIIIVVVAAGAAFVGAFFLSRHFNNAKPVGPAEATAAAAPGAGVLDGGTADKAATPEVPRVEEKQLYELIKEVRQKVRECQKRDQDLDEQERRLQVARQLIERESQDLENLRVQVASSVARLKESQAELEKTRTAIAKDEEVNLKRVAAVYDKMDAVAAARILEGMNKNTQDTDAVKILHYMTERSVAKVMAEFTDKSVAARLCEQMKRIKG